MPEYIFYSHFPSNITALPVLYICQPFLYITGLQNVHLFIFGSWCFQWCLQRNYNPIARINVDDLRYCKPHICWNSCFISWQCCAYELVMFSHKNHLVRIRLTVFVPNNIARWLLVKKYLFFFLAAKNIAGNDTVVSLKIPSNACKCWDALLNRGRCSCL